MQLGRTRGFPFKGDLRKKKKEKISAVPSFCLIVRLHKQIPLYCALPSGLSGRGFSPAISPGDHKRFHGQKKEHKNRSILGAPFVRIIPGFPLSPHNREQTRTFCQFSDPMLTDPVFPEHSRIDPVKLDTFACVFIVSNILCFLYRAHFRLYTKNVRSLTKYLLIILYILLHSMLEYPYLLNIFLLCEAFSHFLFLSTPVPARALSESPVTAS